MQLTRRALLAGAAATALPARAQDPEMAKTSFTSSGRPIAVEVFGTASPAQPAPAILMLHGADGLVRNEQYRAGARAIAAAGYQVFLLHYLDRTGEKRASFGTVFQNFAAWTETVADALSWIAGRPETDAQRIGLVGISLGSALGLSVASDDARIKALVSYFGPLPQGAIAAGGRLPPTLILHGGADPVVPVANAYAIESLLKAQGVEYEMQVYPGQGHGFHGTAHADATKRALSFLARWLQPQAAAATPLSAGARRR